MTWFNYYGLIIMLCLMVPNIAAAWGNRESFENHFDCKALETAEEIGRYGSFILMIFNIPFTYIGWIFSGGELMYLMVNGTLIAAYELIWLIMGKKNNMTKAILLSAIPSVIFVFSGIMIVSVPLILFSILFAMCHISISVKNAAFVDKGTKRNTVITVASLSAALILLLVGACSAAAVKAAVPLKNAADMTAKEMLEYDVKESGRIISIATIKAGNITYATYGEDADESEAYEYEIGSVSKTFLGLIYSKLISEDKISLDDSISKYLKLEGEAYYPTIGRLLTHTSGYEAYYIEPTIIANKFTHATGNDFYGISKEQLLKRVEETRLTDRDYPFRYSNFGIAVLGLVLEEIYQEDYTEIVNDFLLDELGLENTQAAKQQGNLQGYWKWKPEDAYIPAGAVISDIRDMGEYLRICLTADGYISDSFDRVKTVDANDPSYMSFGVRLDSVGMTWMRDDENGIVWHNGATTAFNSYFAFDRKSGTGVVLLGNFAPAEGIDLTIIGARLLSELKTVES